MYLKRNEMELIHGNEIKNILPPVPPYPRFWKKAKENGYTPKEYKELILNSYEFFIMYIRGEECYDYRISSRGGETVRAMDIYCHLGNCVMAKERPKGGYRIVSGYHRAYIARKYNLKILVYVLK